MRRGLQCYFGQLKHIWLVQFPGHAETVESASLDANRSTILNYLCKRLTQRQLKGNPVANFKKGLWLIGFSHVSFSFTKGEHLSWLAGVGESPRPSLGRDGHTNVASAGPA